MTDLITQIRDDREAGTPGPWHWNNKFLNPGVLIAYKTYGTLQGDYIDQANARRIARVPEMERTILDQAEEIERLREATSKAKQLETLARSCLVGLERHMLGEDFPTAEVSQLSKALQGGE